MIAKPKSGLQAEALEIPVRLRGKAQIPGQLFIVSTVSATRGDERLLFN